jgi:predicted nucleic acid-binding protein
MKKKLYIETSVWNQLEHDDRPEWRETAEKFIVTLRRNLYEPYISDVVIREIEATRDKTLQKRLIEHLNTISPVLLQTDEDVEALTDMYMKTGFAAKDSIRVYNDCSHVAIATVNEIRHIVSFNCKHLVNDKRIDAFNAINFQNGYEFVIDITTPHRFLLDMGQETI